MKKPPFWFMPATHHHGGCGVESALVETCDVSVELADGSVYVGTLERVLSDAITLRLLGAGVKSVPRASIVACSTLREHTWHDRQAVRRAQAAGLPAFVVVPRTSPRKELEP